MVNSYYYNGNQYIPRTSEEKEKGLVLASLTSSAIFGTLPFFTRPFERQLVKEHNQNHLYKDAFLRSLESSGLDKFNVKITEAQNFHNTSAECCGQNAYFNTLSREVVINTDKISIAGFHELGHAKNNILGKAGKILSKMRWPGRILAAWMGYIALFSRTKPKDAPPDTTDFIKDNCGKIAFAAMLPTVFEEGLASYNGVKIARKTGVTETLIKNMRKLYGKALLTYIGHAVLTGLAVGASSMIMDKYSRPKKLKMNNFEKFIDF